MSAAVLCVDDDPAVLFALRKTLETIGLEVDTAEGPAVARTKLAEREFAVVISDHNMPSESGLSFLSTLSDAGVPSAAILLTGFADLQLSIGAINRGHVFALLEKPVQTRELLITVRSAVERYELSKSLREKVGELEAANCALHQRNDELRSAHDLVRRLEEAAMTDAKTGAGTYRYFVDRLNEEIARSRRYGHPLGLVLCDLDGFKNINDRYGHVVGDEVLRGVTNIMRGTIRSIDLLARFGGDEFAVVLPDTNLAGAAILGERLRSRVYRTCFEPAEAGELTLSLGVAGLPHHHVEDHEDMIELADRALYQAKTGGRNQCVVLEAAAAPN